MISILNYESSQKIIRSEERQTTPIMQILDQYIGTKKFDFLSIVTEGMDERLLLAIDFKRYRPKVIAIEIGFEEWQKEPLKLFIEKINYKFVGLTLHSSVLLRK